MDALRLLQLTLEAVKKAERSFICCAIEQYAAGDQDLVNEVMKIMEKYKPKGKQVFIGWWDLYDRKSRIEALTKAITLLSLQKGIP